MANYVSGTQTNPGANYTPASDELLAWVACCRKNGTNSASNQLFGAAAMVEPANQDQSINMAGGGDVSGFLANLVSPGTTAEALTVTWAETVLNDLGFAMTIAGVDPTTPVYPTNGSAGGTYTGNASPGLGYDAPAGAVVVYWRIHAQASAINWTDPTNFTPRFTQDLLSTPAVRTLRVWTRDVAAEDLGATVAATSDLVGDGGVHGVVVYQPAPSSGHDLTASNGLIQSIAPGITLTQTHLLSGSDGLISSLALDGTITQTHILSGDNSLIQPIATTGAVVVTPNFRPEWAINSTVTLQ